MARESSPRAYGSETEQVLEDLVRESLRLLLPFTVVVAWGWVAIVWHFARPHLGQAAGIFCLVLATTGLAYRLHRQYLSLATSIYLAGLLLAVVLIALALRNASTLYLFVLVILIAATLTHTRGTWATALLSLLLIAAVGSSGRLKAPADLALPSIFVLLTTSTSWLSSQRLFMALGWTLSMTREAQKNADQARRHRAEVRRVLKSLDEAYARLERANEALLFAREAADKAYRFKAEFVANVSHELRTPLNLIIGFSEMMAMAPESYNGRPMPSEYRGDVAAVYRSARHLADLINDVLDLSQIEAGRLPLSRELVDLAEIVSEATAIVRGLAEGKGLQLQIDLPEEVPLLRLDRTRIRQVLLNLLTNALRYTDRGWIRIHACLDGQNVRLSVQDSGRGIAKEKIASAFEAFSQLDEDRAREGSGLGLAVSRRFVEMHGGTMWIDSVLGQGTTVGFTLPMPESGRDVPALLLRPTEPAASGEAQPAVLVLHDDPQAVALLQRYIGGYRFELVTSVAAACRIIRQTPPAAVVLDNRWAERWRETAQESEFPSVPYLACPLPSLRRLGLHLGAVDCLVKPVTRDRLLGALARLPSLPGSVLVVDDDLDMIRLVTRTLEASHPSMEVLEASNGLEALEITRLQRPDLVLLDLVMPEMDGHAFLREARRDETLGDVQVIIMSAHASEAEKAPLMGELRANRPSGYSLAGLLQAIESSLAAITLPAAAAPANASEPGEERPA